MTTAADFDTDLEEDERRMPWAKIVIGALPLAFVVWFLAFHGDALFSEPQKNAAIDHYPAVAVVFINSETERRAVPIKGYVTAERVAALRAEAPSEVVALLAKPGDSVAKGQPLCRLEAVGASTQTLLSPMTGRVTASVPEVGAVLQRGEACMAVTDPASLLATAELSARHAEVIEAGDAAEISLAGGMVRGEVRVVYPADSRQDQAPRLAEITLADGHQAVPGSSAEVRIRTDQIIAVHIPAGALSLHPRHGMSVRMIEGEGRLGKVRTVPVTLVAATGEGFYVEGLPAEARLVVEDKDFPPPSDGEKVRIGKVV